MCDLKWGKADLVHFGLTCNYIDFGHMGKVTWCIFLSDWDQEREIQICLREIDKFLFTNKTHS